MTEFEDHSDLALLTIEKGVEKALAESVLVLEGNAKSYCPVKTGRLRASINSRSSLLTGHKEGEAEVGTNVEYAPHVEYGTKYQRPKPFLRTGAEDSKYDIEAIFHKRLGSVEIKKDNI